MWNEDVITPGEIRLLKNAGIDIHALKEGMGKAKYFDLFKNKAGDIFQMRKGGTSAPDPTGLNIKDFY